MSTATKSMSPMSELAQALRRSLTPKFETQFFEVIKHKP